MYLTAQRVVSTDASRKGVNVFLYLHGDLAWQGGPPPGVPDQDPGTLASHSISVEPPGNRVQSYLDIIAPDGTPWEEVREALLAFVADSQPSPLPWRGQSGHCAFRLGMDRTLSGRWQKELAVLYRAAQALRLAGAE